MKAEEFRVLWERSFPGWEEKCEDQRRDHAIQELKIQLIRLWLDAWRCWPRHLNRVSMEPLAALCAVAADLRKFMSTGWADFHASLGYTELRQVSSGSAGVREDEGISSLRSGS